MAGFDGDWSGLSQLWWRPAAAGARLTLVLPAPSQGPGRYRVVGWFTRAPDYGDVSVSVNGARLPGVVRGYAPAVAPTGAVSLGETRLRAGDNRLELEVTGKDARSSGFLVGLDGVTLERLGE